MKIRFLADANFNQKIVTGLLRREPRIDFELPQNVVPEGMKDPELLELGAALGRIVVTHDVRTMPDHFSVFAEGSPSPGLILVPKRMAIGDVIEELLLIWHVSHADEWIDQMRCLPL